MQKMFARRNRFKQLDDKDLVALASDDKEAFGELYERYLPKMYNYMFYRTGNVHDAEDLTSRLFFRAMSHIDRFEERGVPFQAWLYRIAHNLLANWHRDQGRRKIIALDDYVAQSLRAEAPDHVAEAAEEQQHLMQAVRRLPEDRQQLLLLKFIDRLPNAEIGEIMGKTEGAIKSLYHRTLLALREELKQPDEQIDERPLSLEQRISRIMDGKTDVEMRELLDDITSAVQQRQDVERLARQSSLPRADVDGLVEIISELDSTLIPIEPRAEFADHLRSQLLTDGQGVMQRWREMPARVHVAALLAVMAGFLAACLAQALRICAAAGPGRGTGASVGLVCVSQA